MASILVLHGPNLNLLGRRQPEIYGQTTLDEINSALQQRAAEQGFTLEHLQSNAEHVLVDRIQQTLSEDCRFIIINPAGFTHTSVVLLDALLATSLPFFEVHISNILAREPFRHHSFLSGYAKGVITGFGIEGYYYALNSACKYLKNR